VNTWPGSTDRRRRQLADIQHRRTQEVDCRERDATRLEGETANRLLNDGGAMKTSIDLRSAVIAAITIQKPGHEADGEGQQDTECVHAAQDKEPNLPKGYSHIQDAIRALLTLDDFNLLATERRSQLL
jgi:hypothetical protein